MKRVLLLIVAALLIPGLLHATATLGVYFDTPGTMTHSPAELVPFSAHLYIHNGGCFITAVEYLLSTPDDPTHALMALIGTSYPDNFQIELGDPFDTVMGHAITYWPPFNGWVPGYNLLATYTFLTYDDCWDAGGGIADYDIKVVNNPGSGALRYTCHPDNNLVPATGLTSIICPELVAVEEESWGAIKSLYR
jgi:hypothetical protein